MIDRHQYQIEWRKANPDYFREYMRLYTKKHSCYNREKKTKYYQDNKERINKVIRLRHKKNPEKYRLKYRIAANMRRTLGKIDEKEWLEKCRALGNMCQI